MKWLTKAVIVILVFGGNLSAQISGEFSNTDETAVRAVSNSGRGVHASSVTNYAIFGFAGTMPAVRGESLSGSGVEGYSKQSFGVYGEGENSTGVYGLNKGNLGAGVAGFSQEAIGTRGVSQDNYGVYGQSFSSVGVYGYSNFNYGVEGLGTNSHGVHGSSAHSYGVYGTSENAHAIHGYGGAGAGVWGYSVHNVGILGTSTNSHGVHAATFSDDHFDFYAGSTGGNNYGSASSRRWKENIRNIPNPLEKVGKLRGVYYDWDEAHGGNHAVGFIAEEVGEVLPEIVVYEENGIDAVGLDYSKMTPLLVEAVNALHQQFQEIIDKQNEKIKMLQSQVEDLTRASANSQ